MIIQGDARYLPLRDGCVQTCVTSPPYWGLRNYGHDYQIGLEPTPEDYVASLVQVFREVWRVLRDDGTVWLNLGDSYSGSGKGGNPDEGKQATNHGSQSIGVLYGKTGATAREAALTNVSRRWTTEQGIRPKQLVGIPWRVAFALQADGWYLRSDIIWAKPNPMPESVTDRPTKAHEYLFLLSKSERYVYDADAIKEPYSDRTLNENPSRDRDASVRYAGGEQGTRKVYGLRNAMPSEAGRNKRSVWTVATQACPEAHFATFPEALIEPCILAGAPMGSLVLDPFIGSGTTGVVCERLSRRWVGVDLTYQHLSTSRTAQRGLMFA